MKVFLFNEEVYLVKLNKITIYIDNEVFTFLGKKTNEKIEVKTDTDFMLRNKFKISCWDEYNDLSQIKFLIRYSSILSNFACASGDIVVSIFISKFKKYLYLGHRFGTFLLILL